jgi:uncharacterized membrane protein
MPDVATLLKGHEADAIGLALYLTIAIGYYVLFTLWMRARPESFLQGRMSWYRHRWIRLIYDRCDGILAVQTYRNQLMSASFLASTAILVDLGLLTLLGLPRQTASFLYGDPADPVAEAWLTVKVVIMIGLYSLNFLSFAVCIRDLNYLSVLSALYGTDDQETEGVLLHVESTLDAVAINYTRGLRGYYFGLPLFLWLLSPYLMMISTVAVLCLLYVRDHAGRLLPAHERPATQ